MPAPHDGGRGSLDEIAPESSVSSPKRVPVALDGCDPLCPGSHTLPRPPPPPAHPPTLITLKRRHLQGSDGFLVAKDSLVRVGDAQRHLPPHAGTAALPFALHLLHVEGHVLAQVRLEQNPLSHQSSATQSETQAFPKILPSVC